MAKANSFDEKERPPSARKKTCGIIMAWFGLPRRIWFAGSDVKLAKASVDSAASMESREGLSKVCPPDLCPVSFPN